MAPGENVEEGALCWRYGNSWQPGRLARGEGRIEGRIVGKQQIADIRVNGSPEIIIIVIHPTTIVPR